MDANCTKCVEITKREVEYKRSLEWGEKHNRQYHRDNEQALIDALKDNDGKHWRDPNWKPSKTYGAVAGCAKCDAITALEKKLNARALEIVNAIIDFYRPVRQKNKSRLEAFAWWCNLRLVGNFFLSFMGEPTLIKESYPEHFDTIGIAEVQKPARDLELLKKDDMAHWGNEPVLTNDGAYMDSDPGYNRATCYALGYSPFAPNKYDFSSAAGVGWLTEHGSCRFDPESKQVIEKDTREWITKWFS